MATNVLGTAITVQTLKKMEEFKDTKYVTMYDLATVAFEAKNDDDKDVKAREYVESYRTKYVVDSILCMIYNATGDTMILEVYQDTISFLAPSPYPMIIGNGQWGVFLKREGGSVVYRARNASGVLNQVAFIYQTLAAQSRCCTEIREANYYKAKDAWAVYKTPLDANAAFIHQAHDRGLSSFASIGGTTKSPVFEGIVTLNGAWSRYRPANEPISLMMTSNISNEDAVVADQIQDDTVQDTTTADADADAAAADHNEDTDDAPVILHF